MGEVGGGGEEGRGGRKGEGEGWEGRGGRGGEGGEGRGGEGREGREERGERGRERRKGGEGEGRRGREEGLGGEEDQTYNAPVHKSIITNLRYKASGLSYPCPLADVGGGRVGRCQGNSPPTATQDGLPQPSVGNIEDIAAFTNHVDMPQHSRAPILLSNLSQLPVAGNMIQSNNYTE